MGDKYYKVPLSRKYPLIVLLFFLCCSEAPIIKNEPANRIVLAEFFTFARCVYCPYAEEALDSLSKEFGDSLAIIAYHRQKLGDTLSPAYVAVRESLYSIQTSPTVVFDGLYNIQTEDPDENYPVFKNYIVNERSKSTQLFLDLETSVSGLSVNTKIHIVPVDSIDGIYYLFLVVTEDSIYFKQAGAPDSIFCYVMREMVHDENGIEVGIAYPDTVVKELNFNLKPTWESNKIGVVCFIQSMANREILQAKIKRRIFD